MRFGYTPDMVDQWPVEWSTGWLLERALEYDRAPEKWDNQPVGLVEEDADYDPWLGGSEPPPGWELLPMLHREEVTESGE